ncbi:MAG: ABC transporter permease [Archaeoglobaceae archaeon]
MNLIYPSLIGFLLLVSLALPAETEKIDLEKALVAPNFEYPFGTDYLGRDVFSRVLKALSIDIGLSLLIVSTSAIIGILLGLISGYYKIFDKLITPIVDAFLAFPEIVFALVIVSSLGPGMLTTAMALIAFGWMRYTRLVRGLVFSLKERDFVTMLRSIGASDRRIIFLHILPNVIPQTIPLITYHLGHSIVSISALGFLGLGVQPPTPELGAMLNEGRFYLMSAWWLTFFPGIFIVLLTFLFIGFGNSLNEVKRNVIRD